LVALALVVAEVVALRRGQYGWGEYVFSPPGGSGGANEN
jgi:hypothetical protein